jgi:predicted Zn-dependent protease
MLSYNRDDEIESDTYGLKAMVDCGYDPRAQAEVMQILKSASGGTRDRPNFLASHPHPDARIEEINKWIKAKYPAGVPANLSQGRTLVNKTQALAIPRFTAFLFRHRDMCKNLHKHYLTLQDRDVHLLY